MQTLASASRYLKSPKFDYFFVLGIPLVAIISALYLVVHPEDFIKVLSLDLLLLGFHHVISTYTRLLFDRASCREHWLLLVPLPILVVGVVYLLTKNFGVALISTIYLHWQWYHYTRQSEGINKAYGIKAKSVQAGHADFNRALFYLLPSAAFLMMSARPNNIFLGETVYKIPIPMAIASIFLTLTFLGLLFWLGKQISALRKGTLTPLHFSYLISHYAIYLIAYVFIEDISMGWIAINIWHNAQYIAFVWLFNINKHKGGVDKKKLVLSWLSQEKNWPLYLAVCMIITIIFYRGVDFASTYFTNFSTIPFVVVFYQTLNFHHYIVDSQIWKLRAKKIQENL